MCLPEVLSGCSLNIHIFLYVPVLSFLSFSPAISLKKCLFSAVFPQVLLRGVTNMWGSYISIQYTQMMLRMMIVIMS